MAEKQMQMEEVEAPHEFIDDPMDDMIETLVEKIEGRGELELASTHTQKP